MKRDSSSILSSQTNTRPFCQTGFFFQKMIEPCFEYFSVWCLDCLFLKLQPFLLISYWISILETTKIFITKIYLFVVINGNTRTINNAWSLFKTKNKATRTTSKTPEQCMKSVKVNNNDTRTLLPPFWWHNY